MFAPRLRKMRGITSGRCTLPVVCLLILASCAKHKLTPVGAIVPPTPPPVPAASVPVGAPLQRAESKAAQPVKTLAQAKRGAPEVNRLLLGPPRMNFVPDVRALKKDVPKIDKITFLVNTDTGTLRPESEATIRTALEAL